MMLADASYIVAIISEDDSAHDRCMAVAATIREPLMTTWPCNNRILTLDRHFYAYRINGQTPFEVLP